VKLGAIETSAFERTPWRMTLASTSLQSCAKLVEKNVEQAQAAYGQFIDFLTQVSSTAPTNKMLPGLEAVRARAIEFARENGERFFDLARCACPRQRYPGGADPSKPVRAGCWQGYYPPMAERLPSPELSYSPRDQLPKWDLEP
jgi:hypothetical protein